MNIFLYLLRLILALALFLTVLVAGGGLILFSCYLDSQSFRTQLVERLSAAVGRKLVLGGELDVSLYPLLGLEAWDISLGNPPGCGDAPFIHVDHLLLGLNLGALLDKRVDLSTVIVEGAQVSLVLLPDGHGNWEGWGAQDPEGPTVETAAKPIQEPSFSLLPILIRGLAVSGASVFFEDRASGEVFESSKMSLRTGRIVPGEPVAFNLESGLGWENMGLDAKAIFSGKMITDFAGEPAALFQGASLQLDVTGGLLLRGGRAVLLADVDFDYKAGDLSLHNFRMKTMGLQLSGSVTARNLYLDPQVQGQLEIKPLNLWQFLELNYPEAAPRRPGEALGMASFRSEVTGNRTSLALTNMALALDESVLRGDLTMKDFSKPQFLFNLELNRLDVDRYVALWGEKGGESKAGNGEQLEPSLDLRFLSAALLSSCWSGQLAVGLFRSSGLQWSDCLLEGAGFGNRTRLELKSSSVLGGTLGGELLAQTQERQDNGAPALQLSASLRAADLDMARLSILLEQRSWSLSGKGVGMCSVQLPVKNIYNPVPLREALAEAKIEAAFSVFSGILALTSEGHTGRSPFARAEAQFRLAPSTQPPGEEGLIGAADLALTVLRDSPRFQVETWLRGPLTLPKSGGFRVRDAALHVALQAIQPKIEEFKIECSGQVDLDSVAQTLAVHSLKAQGPGQRVTGILKGVKIFGAPVFSGRLEVHQADLKRLLLSLGVTPPAMAVPASLSKLVGSTDFQVNAKSLSCSNMKLRLDHTPVTGKFSLSNFYAPRYEFQLQTGALDFDRYLPPKGKKDGAAAQSSAAKKKALPETLPLGSLRRLDLNGEVVFESLKVYGLTFKNLKLAGSADRGDIKIRPITSGFYEGNLTGSFSLKTESKFLNAAVNLDAEAFQIGSFLNDGLSKEYLRGFMDFKADLTSFGATNMDLLRNLAGRMRLRIGEGSYRLFGLGMVGMDNKDKAHEQTARTNYDSLSASLIVQRGVFSTSDFVMKGGVVSATGKGQFSLADESVEMLFNAVLLATPNLPIRMYGNLYDPSVALPPGKLLGNTVEDILGIPAKSFKILKDLVF